MENREGEMLCPLCVRKGEQGMQGAYRCGREKHEKARTKYTCIQLSDSSETVLNEGQRKGDVNALLFH